MNNRILVLIFLLGIPIFSQEIPVEFELFKRNNFQIDIGKSWKYNSTFGYNRFQNFENELFSSDTNYIYSRLGFNKFDNVNIIYGFSHFTFNKYLYTYLYSRIVNYPDLVDRYSGKPRDISRFGFRSGEMDLGGIGFQNNWITLQYGRGTQSWGAGNGIQLAISHNSNPYDYGLFKFEINDFKFCYFHGFLENYNENNRYLVGKGIEWNNRNDILLSLSELVIYSGHGRPLDISYLNPISSHLEIELNDRQNLLGTESGNAVWQFSLDYLMHSKIRISGNFLIDEFILDKIEKEQGKINGIAFSLRGSYLISYPRFKMLAYSSFIHVGPHTFRHNGYNNFVNRNSPLGWKWGSDTEEFRVGVELFKFKKFNYAFVVGRRNSGQGNILSTPYTAYDNYEGGAFPSGLVNEVDFMDFSLNYWIWKRLSFYNKIVIEKSNLYGKNNAFKFGFDFYFETLNTI
ncbi:MAG: hypothetical protein CMI96_01285 [Pelagibacteraceae bacterium]|nr:hypothetical protein [Pelagibacteraceae bacterium]